MSYGIICEYNPFHNGHLYQINRIKEDSSEPVICVMSGNFTQRGELAILDKYARANIALSCGADLVLELPFPFCSSSAEFFALAGVRIAESAGVDKLSFGSESADPQRLTSLARVASSEEFRTTYSALAKTMGNAKAYFETLKALSLDAEDISSNDILGIEYIKAIINNGYSITPCPIKREGAKYTEQSLFNGTNPSATAVRGELLIGNMERIRSFVPAPCYEAIEKGELAQTDNVGRGILLSLRLMNETDCKALAISDEGLINRIIQCANQATSYAEFEELVACKKYTDSAIRRAILYMLTGVTLEDLKAGPAYTNLLAANERGREILSALRKSDPAIPIITKPADAYSLQSETAKRQAALSQRADAIYSLAFDSAKPSDEFIKRKPTII